MPIIYEITVYDISLFQYKNKKYDEIDKR